MSALLDHESTLPSSDDGACTSTVVEVAQSSSDNYEAEIEFISEEVNEFRELAAVLVLHSHDE